MQHWAGSSPCWGIRDTHLPSFQEGPSQLHWVGAADFLNGWGWEGSRHTMCTEGAHPEAKSSLQSQEAHHFRSQKFRSMWSWYPHQTPLLLRRRHFIGQGSSSLLQYQVTVGRVYSVLGLWAVQPHCDLFGPPAWVSHSSRQLMGKDRTGFIQRQDHVTPTEKKPLQKEV